MKHAQLNGDDKIDQLVTDATDAVAALYTYAAHIIDCFNEATTAWDELRKAWKEQLAVNDALIGVA
jgi:hypothetical protein